MSPNKSKI